MHVVWSYSTKQSIFAPPVCLDNSMSKYYYRFVDLGSLICVVFALVDKTREDFSLSNMRF